MAESTTETFSSEKSKYYADKLSKFLEPYKDSLIFDKFVSEKHAVELGNKLLSSKLSRGYNFATLDQFPVDSPESLIFYGVYAQRIYHLGEILGRMENQGIIKESDIRFGIRGTKVFGKWDDPECEKEIIVMDGGGEDDLRKSVEAVLVFRPHKRQSDTARKVQMARIVRFLRSEALTIGGAYDVPDIRTTATQELKEVFIGPEEDLLKLEEAVANIYHLEKGRVIALTQETHLGNHRQGWENYGSLVNPELYNFLRVPSVLP